MATIAIVLNVISYALLGFTLSEWAFILSAVLMGIYQSMLTPTFNAMAMKMAPESRSGAASSTYWLGFDGGMAVGMLFFGVIIDWGSYPAAFLFAAAYMAILESWRSSSCAKSSRCARSRTRPNKLQFPSSSFFCAGTVLCRRTLSGRCG